MKVKVIKEFTDAHTSELHKVGSVIEVSDERFAEIKAVDSTLISAVNDSKAVSEVVSTPKAQTRGKRVAKPKTAAK